VYLIREWIDVLGQRERNGYCRVSLRIPARRECARQVFEREEKMRPYLIAKRYVFGALKVRAGVWLRECNRHGHNRELSRRHSGLPEELEKVSQKRRIL
jgi:hypothetical protein